MILVSMRGARTVSIMRVLRENAYPRVSTAVNTFAHFVQ